METFSSLTDEHACCYDITRQLYQSVVCYRTSLSSVCYVMVILSHRLSRTLSKQFTVTSHYLIEPVGLSF